MGKGCNLPLYGGAVVEKSCVAVEPGTGDDLVVGPKVVKIRILKVYQLPTTNCCGPARLSFLANLDCCLQFYSKGSKTA